MCGARIFSMAALAALLPSCGNAPVAPPADPIAGVAGTPVVPSPDSLEIVLLLSSTSGEPGRPVDAAGSVTNRGEDALFYFRGSGCDLMNVSVIGPDGRPVQLRDPTEPLPSDPCSEQRLGPGQARAFGSTFTETLYTNAGSMFQAPSGIYTFVVDALAERPGGWVAAEQRARFEWQGNSFWRGARRVPWVPNR